jgi:hypothetical protein
MTYTAVPISDASRRERASMIAKSASEARKIHVGSRQIITSHSRKEVSEGSAVTKRHRNQCDVTKGIESESVRLRSTA